MDIPTFLIAVFVALLCPSGSSKPVPLFTPLVDNSSEQKYHRPVLAHAVVDILITDPDGIYIDCTVGGGGHSSLIFERLSKRGRLFGCDRDSDAIAHARSVLPDSVRLVQCRFSEIERKLAGDVDGGTAGVLMDLGVSSYQLDTPARGFSNRFPGPLDLRMDPTSGETAADVLSRLDVAELAQIIFAYGEEPQARRIAKAIIQERERHPVDTTDTLARIIDRSVPATRTKSLARVFQALRIAVNHELEELESGLAGTWNLLKPGGRLVVISYHSLEDRIVKNFMKSKAEPAQTERRLPVPLAEPSGRLLIKKPQIPDANEIEENPRARSAKMRAIEKTA